MVKENKESLMRWLNSCNTDTPQSEPRRNVGFFYAQILPQRMRRSLVNYERPNA